jgi:transposase
MSRSKTTFTEDLAARALADLGNVDRSDLARKLQAIIAATKHPVAQAAEVAGVATETVWRWANAYSKNGLEGLKGKLSKLTNEQRAEALSWLNSGETIKGGNAHWTLDRLRRAISQEFGVALSITAVWVWLRKEGRSLRAPRPRQ